MDELIWWHSSSGRIEFQLPRQCIEDCSHSGACDADVFNWASQLEERLAIDTKLIIRELSEYGCWDKVELEALTKFELLEKIIWIAANDLSDELFTSEA